MSRQERRNPPITDPGQLRAGLTPEQLATLETLEHFRWVLRFVRRPLFRDPVPVCVHPDGKRIVVLEADGSINESPDIRLRD